MNTPARRLRKRQLIKWQPRDAGNWAQQFASFKVGHVPTGMLGVTVDGRLPAGPLEGFGQLWQKTYRVPLKNTQYAQREPVTPQQVMKVWRDNFTMFWPRGNRFHIPLTGLAPGEVALINMAMPGGMRLSTGVMVLYADDVSFTVMTPQGHVFAGWNTFSSYEEDGCVFVQVQVLIRAGDPLYEIGFRLGASKTEDAFWQHTLKALAAFFGSHEPAQMEAVCIDPQVQWAYAKNVWHNAFIRTTLYRMTTPLRTLQRRKRR